MHCRACIFTTSGRRTDGGVPGPITIFPAAFPVIVVPVIPVTAARFRFLGALAPHGPRSNYRDNRRTIARNIAGNRDGEEAVDLYFVIGSGFNVGFVRARGMGARKMHVVDNRSWP